MHGPYTPGAHGQINAAITHISVLHPLWSATHFSDPLLSDATVGLHNRPGEEDVSDLLIACQTDTPNSYRLTNRPITKSCMRSVLEKQIVRRTNRLIRVRKLICLLSIFCVFAFPTVCCLVSTCRS